MALSTSKAMQIAQRAHSREIRRRHTVKGFEHALIRKAAVMLTAGAYGTLKRNSVPDEVAGFPWKIAAWAGSTLIEILANNGTVKSFAGGISDATAAIYMDRSIVNKTLVSGNEF
jgi:hypothetical protein